MEVNRGTAPRDAYIAIEPSEITVESGTDEESRMSPSSRHTLTHGVADDANTESDPDRQSSGSAAERTARDDDTETDGTDSDAESEARASTKASMTPALPRGFSDVDPFGTEWEEDCRWSCNQGEGRDM
jgi:hypothetical protein